MAKGSRLTTCLCVLILFGIVIVGIFMSLSLSLSLSLFSVHWPPFFMQPALALLPALPV